MNTNAFPYITVCLLIANIVVQALVVLNAHGTYPDLMYQFGALVYPSDLTQGHWWRILTAAFLHSGWGHFGANMTNFVFFPYAEKALGHWRFLLIYLVAIIGSDLLTFQLWSLFDLHPGITMVMGASGAITGILGAFIASSVLAGEAKGKNSTQSMYPGMLILIGFQIYNDMVNLHGGLGSLWFHLFGFVIGFTLGYGLLSAGMPKEGRSTSRTNPIIVVWSLVVALAIGMSIYDKSRLTPPTTMDEISDAYYAHLAGDDKESVRKIHVSAQMGNPLAQSILGSMYAEGDSVKKNPDRAAYWWEKAACQGNAPAAISLSDYYEKKQDWASALRWKRTALEATTKPDQRTVLLKEIQALKSKI